MPKAKVTLWQSLLQYGLPVIALSAAGSFSLVLLSGNTFVFDMFDNWFNTNNHYHTPNESPSTDEPKPDFRPDSQIPNINIQLPSVSVDPEVNVVTPITVDPWVNIAPELNLTPKVDVQFTPEFNLESNISPTQEFNPDLSSDFNFAPSLEFVPEVTISPFFQNNSERPLILTNPDGPFNVGPGPTPIEAIVPIAPTQPPEPTVSTVPDTPAQLPVPKALQEKPISSKQPDPLENAPGNIPEDPEFDFQFPEDKVQTLPGTPIITFDPEDLPLDLPPQLTVGKDLLPGFRDLPAASSPGRSAYHPTDSSDKSVSVPEPRMVMTILLFGLGLFRFRKKY